MRNTKSNMGHVSMDTDPFDPQPIDPLPALIDWSDILYLFRRNVYTQFFCIFLRNLVLCFEIHARRYVIKKTFAVLVRLPAGWGRPISIMASVMAYLRLNLAFLSWIVCT